MMKALLSVLGIILVMAIGGIALLPKLVPMETVMAKVKEQVKAATGRDLDFSSAKIVFWPNIGVEMENATLSNPVWAKEKNMISIVKADIRLALTPLLQRRIEVKKFVLNAPVVFLETGADGKNSWEFSKAAAAEGEPAPVSAGESGMAQDFDFRLGHIQISDGKLTFLDQKKGGTTVVEDVDLEVNAADLKGAMRVGGDLTYKGKRVHVDAGVDSLSALLQGKASPGQVMLKAEGLTAKAEGALSTRGTLLKGNVEAAIDSLPALLAWASGAASQSAAFEKISFSGEAQLTASDAILKDMTLTLDDVKAEGDMSVGFSGTPDIFARLSIGKINLDRFTGGDAAGGDTVGKQAEKSSTEWDATPMDLSGLKAVNADLELKTDGFIIKGADVGPSVLTVTLQNGNLHFKSSEAGMFSGKVSSDLTFNTSQKTPAMAFKFNMSGVQAKPLLTAFAGFKKLSGLTDASVSVTGAGDSQKALVSSLKGDGSFVFRNGSLEGIDLAKIARLVQQHIADVGVGEGKTDFVELGGTFTVNNGVANNADMQMKGPLLRATGQGDIDFPRKFIQYRVLPVLITSATAEGGVSGLSVPVDIAGPFSHIKVKPDFASAVQDIINDPEAAKAALKGVREQGKALKQDLKLLKKNPLKALGNFLSGGGLFGDQAEEAPPASAPETAPAPVPPAQ